MRTVRSGRKSSGSILFAQVMLRDLSLLIVSQAPLTPRCWRPPSAPSSPPPPRRPATPSSAAASSAWDGVWRHILLPSEERHLPKMRRLPKIRLCTRYFYLLCWHFSFYSRTYLPVIFSLLLLCGDSFFLEGLYFLFSHIIAISYHYLIRGGIALRPRVQDLS